MNATQKVVIQDKVLKLVSSALIRDDLKLLCNSLYTLIDEFLFLLMRGKLVSGLLHSS